MKYKIVFLSRYQDKVHRGAETFTAELSKRLAKSFSVAIFSDFSFKKINKIKPDIIIPINGGLQALLVKIYCIFTNTKLIISGQAGLGRPDKWNLLLKPDAFVALTPRNADWAKKYSFKVNIKTIPNGVDLNTFKPQGKKIKINLSKPIILCVAGPEKYKRVEETIKAVAGLKNTSLLLAGGSFQQNKLGKQLLGKRFLNQKFTHQQMPAVYRSADVFTLASDYCEAFAIAYLEALASGLPIVAPDDELRQQILGPHALYVKDITDLNQYSQKFKQALEKKAFRPEKWLKQFSWDNIAQQYKELCLNLLE